MYVPWEIQTFYNEVWEQIPAELWETKDGEARANSLLLWLCCKRAEEVMDEYHERFPDWTPMQLEMAAQHYPKDPAELEWIDGVIDYPFRTRLFPRTELTTEELRIIEESKNRAPMEQARWIPGAGQMKYDPDINPDEGAPGHLMLRKIDPQREKQFFAKMLSEEHPDWTEEQIQQGVLWWTTPGSRQRPPVAPQSSEHQKKAADSSKK